MQDTTPAVNLDLSIKVEDVIDRHNRLGAAGVPIARGIKDTPWGYRTFEIDDPDGQPSGPTKSSKEAKSSERAR